MVNSVIDCEFPSMDIFAAFSAFSLNHLRGPEVLEDTGNQLQRLSQAFGGLDACGQKLRSQFEYLRPVALAIWKERGVTAAEAWSLALQRVLQSSFLRKLHPMDELRKIIIEWRTYLATTAGVEQGFAKTRWGIRRQQLAASESMENVVCKLLLDFRPSEESEVVKGARSIWAAVYGEARQSPKLPRVHKGKPIKKLGRSEASWLRDRRAAVARAATQPPDFEGLTQRVKAKGLPSTAEKELAFQDRKRAKRQSESYHKGHLLDHEITESVRTAAAEHAEKTRKADRSWQVAEEKTQKLLTRGSTMSSQDLRGKRVYLDATLDTGDLRIAAARAGLLRVSDRISAEVFLVIDPVNMSARVRCVAMLVGGYVTNNLFESVHTVSLAFKPALTIKRTLYVSEAFRQGKPTIFGIIRSLVTHWPGSKWNLVESTHTATFVGLNQSARVKQDVVALVTRKEAKERAHKHSTPLDIYAQTV